MKKAIVLLLAICAMLSSVCAVPVDASLAYSEDPLMQKNFEEFGAAVESTEETVEAEASQETQAEQPAAEPTEEMLQMEPEGTVPAETEPAVTPETVPEQPKQAELQTASETATATKTTEPVEAPKELDEPKGHNGVPLYFQTDYPNNMYGMGTIANNGCSAACLAMVATYMTEHEYLPDEIARYFGGAAENNIARLEQGSDVMKLAYKKARDWPETLAAVYDGKLAIVLVDSRSVFTQSQHFIIITGFTEDGKLLVNDSLESNYEKWDCKEGLRNGFSPDAILAGYSGAWIYDKEAMPEEPFLYSEPEPVRGEPRYGIELTWEEIQLLAKVVWVESRGESEEGQQAVAEVILNRLVSDQFPDTLRNVVYAENQFRSAKFLSTAQPYQMQYEVIENALYGPYVLPMDVYYFATTPKTEKVWGEIGGHYFCYADD